jgi:hypothetical protein
MRNSSDNHYRSDFRGGIPLLTPKSHGGSRVSTNALWVVRAKLSGVQAPSHLEGVLGRRWKLRGTRERVQGRSTSSRRFAESAIAFRSSGSEVITMSWRRPVRPEPRRRVPGRRSSVRRRCRRATWPGELDVNHLARPGPRQAPALSGPPEVKAGPDVLPRPDAPPGQRRRALPRRT